MSIQTLIKEKAHQVAKELKQDPAGGRSSSVTTTRIIEGLSCEVTDGPWSLKVGFTKDLGGDDAAPDPGVYGRSALGSCLAIGYMIWASRLDVPIKSLEVEVETDFDACGLLGTADVAPGYSAVKIHIRVESDAPDEEVMAMLDAGDKHSPYLDVFTRPIACERQVTFV